MKKTGMTLAGLGLALIGASASYALPDQEPLLQLQDLAYEGAFRVPKGNLGGSSTRGNTLAYGGQPIIYNPSRNSLLIADRDKNLLEISIPPAVKSSDITKLNTAKLIQPPINPTDNNWMNLAAGKLSTGIYDAVPGGGLIFGNKLILTAYEWYGTLARYSHFVSSPDWSSNGVTTSSGFENLYQVGTNPVNPSAPNASLVGGYMANIPLQWQPYLGGPALTGMAAISIISRTSAGPAAYVFSPFDLKGADTVKPAEMLLGYPAGYQTALGSYSDKVNPQPIFNSGVEIRGLVFPSGSRSVLFFGRYGYGTKADGTTNAGINCYGAGTTVLSEVKSLAEMQTWFSEDITRTAYKCGPSTISAASGNACCYDNVDPNVKGPHMVPYIYRIWAYDAKDLAEVHAKRLNPWDLKPYGVWDLDLPFAPGDRSILGAAYDPSTQQIFLSQRNGDKPALEPFPMIHVFKLNLAPAPKPPANLKATITK